MPVEYDSFCIFEPTDTLNGTEATASINVRPPWGLAPSSFCRAEDRKEAAGSHLDHSRSQLCRGTAHTDRKIPGHSAGDPLYFTHPFRGFHSFTS